jgi:hypothetical protein
MRDMFKTIQIKICLKNAFKQASRKPQVLLLFLWDRIFRKFLFDGHVAKHTENKTLKYEKCNKKF